MTYSVEHLYVNVSGASSILMHGGVKTAHFSASGDLPIRHPGRFNVFVRAVFRMHINGDLPSQAAHSARPTSTQVPISLTTRIYTPDGQLFARDHVTLADLEQFRDLRHVSQGNWRYEVSGTTDPIPLEAHDSASPGDATVRIALEETVTSKSAGWLVSAGGGTATEHIFSFDLFRVGEFIATVTKFGGVVSATASLRLIDPDGQMVATGTGGRLNFAVGLRTLDKSRDASGNVRPWKLQVTSGGPNLGETITATVVATTRVPVSVLQDRINDLLGPYGANLSVFGQNKDGRALARFEILDEFSAETIDMYGLLDKVLARATQDSGVDIHDIQRGVVYNVANRNADLSYGLSMDVGSVRVTAIDISIGPSQHISPVVPALRVTVAVTGNITLQLEGFDLVSVSVNDNLLALEVGLALDSTGSVTLQSWMRDDPLDISINWEDAVLAGLLTGALGLLGVAGLEHYVQGEVNDKIVQGFRSIVEEAILSAPKIMAMLLGADFTIRSLRMDGGALVIDYVAPTEPDPKPNAALIGVIGRSAIELGPNLWQLEPRSLGNTWAADNLAKIDHIVVVMMENRSFDHVLGYRMQMEDPDAYGEYVQSLYEQGFPITWLKNSGILANAAGLKTRFPAQVGHKLADVAQQLGATPLQIPSGSSVLNPQGFIDNFALRVPTQLQPTDILGIYDGSDLAMYKFLADNYAHCERYYSSHPGPTLPNRMYSISGDVEYDRTGEAILDNNNGDNFALSRGLSIFDVLTRKSVSWRVYESFPSITMLRMFARYVGDNTNIVPLSRLARDISGANLPSVMFIDPAMHSAPENDDHPVADMLYGQMFIKSVYDALRANASLWLKTALIITYDEHGGFFDHVIPPLAEIRSLPNNTNKLAALASAKASMRIPYGVRVPTFVVSPWVTAGKGPDVTLDHCSILKTILARFCAADRPFLSDRVDASLTFNRFLSQRQPRLSEIPASPTLPSLPAIASDLEGAVLTKPVSRRALRTGEADFHDLTGMLARTLGRRYVRPATAATVGSA